MLCQVKSAFGIGAIYFKEIELMRAWLISSHLMPGHQPGGSSLPLWLPSLILRLWPCALAVYLESHTNQKTLNKKPRTHCIVVELEVTTPRTSSSATCQLGRCWTAQIFGKAFNLIFYGFQSEALTFVYSILQ